jgi:hypothetical protein
VDHLRHRVGEVAAVQDALGCGPLAAEHAQQAVDLLREGKAGHVEVEALGKIFL